MGEWGSELKILKGAGHAAGMREVAKVQKLEAERALAAANTGPCVSRTDLIKEYEARAKSERRAAVRNSKGCAGSSRHTPRTDKRSAKRRKNL